MINLLRGEWYQLIRNKSLYTCGIVLMIVTIGFYGMFFLMDSIQQGEIQNGTYGLEVSVDADVVSVWDEIHIADIVNVIYSGIGMVIIAIFVSNYVYGAYANGAIKNIVGKGYSRTVVFTARCISAALGVIFLQLVIILTMLCCEAVLLKADRLSGPMLLDVGQYTLVQMLLGVAITEILVVINQICRNLGLGIGVSVCLICFSGVLMSGIDTLCHYLNIKMNISDYCVMEISAACTMGAIQNSFVLRACVCAVVWFAVTYVIGMFHFGKVDVK